MCVRPSNCNPPLRDRPAPRAAEGPTPSRGRLKVTARGGGPRPEVAGLPVTHDIAESQIPCDFTGFSSIPQRFAREHTRVRCKKPLSANPWISAKSAILQYRCNPPPITFGARSAPENAQGNLDRDPKSLQAALNFRRFSRLCHIAVTPHPLDLARIWVGQGF